MSRTVLSASILVLVSGCFYPPPPADSVTGRPRTTWAEARELCTLWEPDFSTSAAAFNAFVGIIEAFRDDGVSRSYALSYYIATCEDSQWAVNVGACNLCMASVVDAVYP